MIWLTISQMTMDIFHCRDNKTGSVPDVTNIDCDYKPALSTE